MKILVVSDSHGRDFNLEAVLERVKPIDLCVHCGDVEGSADYLEVIAECPVHIVAGNNDHFSDLEREEMFFVGNHKVLLTHGHYYYVSMGTRRIREIARERGCDVVLFGHTHRPLLEMHDDVTLCNPGSISYPRQDGRKPSFLIMELDRMGELHYTLNYC